MSSQEQRQKQRQEERAKRQASALRANLKRRKAMLRQSVEVSHASGSSSQEVCTLSQEGSALEKAFETPVSYGSNSLLQTGLLKTGLTPHEPLSFYDKG